MHAAGVYRNRLEVACVRDDAGSDPAQGFNAVAVGPWIVCVEVAPSGGRGCPAHVS